MKKVNKIWFYFHWILIYGKLSVLAKPAVKTDIWQDKNDQEEEQFVNNVNFSSAVNHSRLPRVLNFFPVPIEEECNANDGRRKGVCMNTYECRMKGGKSYGFCAYGFGVCCVFTATCDQEISNNITYFVNPDFPDLTRDMSSCSLRVKKMDEEIGQLRLDFVHFNLGQPNRKNGICEEDIFLMTTGSNSRDITLCGLNSGQHIYFDVDNTNDFIEIKMNMSRKAVTRLWEVKVTQMPFSQRAPAGCLQYYEGTTGIIQTMNFADNGRHLANQDYNICIRQEDAMCSIVYEPCHENAFRISPNSGDDYMEVGSGDYTDDDDEAGIVEGRQMDSCGDKITIPCESDDLLLSGEEDMIQGICDVIHCGSTLCPDGEDPCRIESTVTPFVVGVHFGRTVREASPEENLGMCLTYEQQDCNV
uniref:Uncharacterized protein LOC114327953 n=1 Tax=Diabrotica virgifera virgifera TaxID=50390 RepID=A0A6P7FGW5_DIAVI